MHPTIDTYNIPITYLTALLHTFYNYTNIFYLVSPAGLRILPFNIGFSVVDKADVAECLPWFNSTSELRVSPTGCTSNLPVTVEEEVLGEMRPNIVHPKKYTPSTETNRATRARVPMTTPATAPALSPPLLLFEFDDAVGERVGEAEGATTP